MFVAMNNFDVVPKRETDFERIWLERDTYLQRVSGFVEFALLRGDTPGALHLTQHLGEPGGLPWLDPAVRPSSKDTSKVR